MSIGLGFPRLGQRPNSSSASRLTAAQVRALDSSQSAAPPGAAVRVLALEDAFDPEQATDQATVRPRAPYTPRPQARDCSRTQAPTAESSPAPENFFAKKPSTERLPPFWGRNRFWTGFWERGHEQFSESNSPPYGGSHLPLAHPSSFEIQVELDHGRRVAMDPASRSQQLGLAIVG
jgi:hypothetical protein